MLCIVLFAIVLILIITAFIVTLVVPQTTEYSNELGNSTIDTYIVCTIRQVFDDYSEVLGSQFNPIMTLNNLSPIMKFQEHRLKIHQEIWTKIAKGNMPVLIIDSYSKLKQSPRSVLNLIDIYFDCIVFDDSCIGKGSIWKPSNIQLIDTIIYSIPNMYLLTPLAATWLLKGSKLTNLKTYTLLNPIMYSSDKTIESEHNWNFDMKTSDLRDRLMWSTFLSPFIYIDDYIVPQNFYFIFDSFLTSSDMICMCSFKYFNKQAKIILIATYPQAEEVIVHHPTDIVRYVKYPDYFEGEYLTDIEVQHTALALTLLNITGGYVIPRNMICVKHLSFPGAEPFTFDKQAWVGPRQSMLPYYGKQFKQISLTHTKDIYSAGLPQKLHYNTYVLNIDNTKIYNKSSNFERLSILLRNTYKELFVHE
jgi:hypothetical protein